jgi:hypothetical protein
MTNKLPGVIGNIGSALVRMNSRLSTQTQTQTQTQDAGDSAQRPESQRSQAVGGVLGGIPGAGTGVPGPGSAPLASDIKAMPRPSLTRQAVDYTQTLIFGAPRSVTEPEKREYLEFVKNRAGDYTDAKYDNWSTKGLTPPVLNGQDLFANRVGIEERFRQFLPPHLDDLFKAWTGSGEAHLFTEGAPLFDHVDLCNALEPNRLDQTAANKPATVDQPLVANRAPQTVVSTEKKEQFLAKAALSSQLVNVLAMLGNDSTASGPTTLYRTLGYMNPNDPRAQQQLQDLAANKPVQQSVLTSVSDNPAFGEGTRGAGALEIRMAPGLRAPSLSGSRVFDGESERNLACVRFEPQAQIKPNVFAVEAVLDLEAVNTCIAQCVAHDVLSPEQAQDLHALLAREPAVLHALGQS